MEPDGGVVAAPEPRPRPAGHHRTHAAFLAGLTAIPAWVRAMDDDAAFMALVLSNAQGELSPLERGMHALQATEKGKHGRSVAAYAREIGRAEQNVRAEVWAADVLDEIHTHVWTSIDRLVTLHQDGRDDLEDERKRIEGDLAWWMNQHCDSHPDATRGTLSMIGDFVDAGKLDELKTEVANGIAGLFVERKFDNGERQIDRTRHLAELHAAPSSSWPVLVRAMLDGGWTVKDAQKHARAVREAVEVVSLGRASKPFTSVSYLMDCIAWN